MQSQITYCPPARRGHVLAVSLCRIARQFVGLATIGDYFNRTRLTESNAMVK